MTADRPNIKRIKSQTGGNSARRSERNNQNYNKIMHESMGPLGEEKMPLRNKSFTSGSAAMKQSRLRGSLANTQQHGGKSGKNSNSFVKDSAKNNRLIKP